MFIRDGTCHLESVDEWENLGSCPRIKFASSLESLLAIEIPSKHLEVLLSQSSSFLGQDIHTRAYHSITVC